MVRNKTKAYFIALIFLFLLGDVFASTLSEAPLVRLWCNVFRVLTWTSIGLWYYEEQKEHFGKIQKIFLLSLVLPIVSSFSVYLLDYKLSTLIYIGISCISTILWAYIFKLLGASYTLNKLPESINRLIILFILFPFGFYFFILFDLLNLKNNILVLLFLLIFAYTSVLSGFLPISEFKKNLISFTFILLAFTSIINSYHIFIEKSPLLYIIVRIMNVVSRCLLIFAMIDIDKASIATEED